MVPNEAIAKLMREKKITQAVMARALGLKGANGVAMRVSRTNITCDNLIEMLNVLGYELVVQPRKPGKRPEGQIVLERSEEKEEK